jgi:hypothetical protein
MPCDELQYKGEYHLLLHKHLSAIVGRIYGEIQGQPSTSCFLPLQSESKECLTNEAEDLLQGVSLVDPARVV